MVKIFCHTYFKANLINLAKISNKNYINMALIEKAAEYILNIITEDETVKGFPKEFIAESAKWVKSWFLKPEDPKTNAKLEDPNKSIEVKKDIIQDKLADLKGNTQFQKELTERLAAFEQQRSRLKNVVSNADIDVKGSVHIGDKGSSSGDNYDEKNIIKGSTIKAGGDFRLGDDVISGNQNVQIVHNYFNGGKGTENTPPQYPSLKSHLKTLLAKEKTAEVIEQLLDYTDNKDSDTHNTVLLLSARLTRINNQENKGIISNGEANIERNKINAALTSLIDELRFD
jgi:hypothetical protein